MPIILPRALLAVSLHLAYCKAIEMGINLISERDFFKSGHLQFVHSLKEGLIIVNDRLKSIMLINVAAHQML